MLVTEVERYIVHGVRRHHVWLEVLEGEDTGLRVSIPMRSEEYDDDMRDKVQSLKENMIVSAVLVSESEDAPSWRPRSIEVIKE